MKKNTVELRDSIHQMVLQCRSMVETCKKEQRNMTEEEDKEFNELKDKIEEKKRELNELEEELKNYDAELPDDLEDSEENSGCEEKNNRNITMKNTLVKELRNALDNNIKTIKVPAETRTVQVNGDSGQVHDHVVEKEIQGILEPLYAKSVLAQLGVKWYTGLPKGDISVPVMGKGNVGWAGEIASATASGNTFTSILLQPKRLTAYVDISKQLLTQDSIGVEEAIRRDIVNALNDKLEATIFGTEVGSTTQPAGIFNGKELTLEDTYKKVCAAEAQVEAANVYGEMKYLMSPSAKAFYRSLTKGANNTGMVYANNEMDGTPALVTSNINAGDFVYGDFTNLAIGSWGDIDITIDEYTQAVNGCVRLVVNAYFDAKVLRNEAFAFGKISA